LKKTIIYIVLFFSLPLHGQISLTDDTIKIKEVVISGNKFISDHLGYKKTTIDSSILFNYSSGNLSVMLSENTDIFIKSYGMGGIATPAFRGTGAGHTLIDWNGIDINSPMLGQSDLSLIPVGLIDDISIYFGGASIQLNNGGIGGTINLETKPVWKKESLISMSAGIGSFGRYTGLFKMRTGNYSFQTVTKAFFQSSENNFRYLNTEISADPVWQTRTNNQVRQKGFIQEFYFRNKKNVGSARIWYQSADRNLPSSILSQQPGSVENQLDESLRAILTYDTFKGRSNFSVTGAWMFGRLNYINRLASIDSRNISETLTLKAALEIPVRENTKLKIVLDEKSSLVRSNNYDHNASNNAVTICASAERNIGRFSTMILLREIIDNHTLLIPDFSAGLQFRLFAGKDYFLKANISRNSKIPTMNDMYWVPGGNPDLKNEYAFIYEISSEMNQKISDLFDMKYEMAVFRYSIKDMIQWHPGEYSYWTADNIKTVNSTGLESSVSLNYKHNKLNAALNAGYSFTKAVAGGLKIENDLSAGNQLMYIPVNQVNMSLRIGFWRFYSSWITDFTGKRFITLDNSKYLPWYFINNFNAGIRLPVKSTSIDMNFSIDNILNKNYQSIAYYPLPGRSYFIKILVQIIK
jgi:outer membrane cobalamin receptor